MCRHVVATSTSMLIKWQRLLFFLWIWGAKDLFNTHFTSVYSSQLCFTVNIWKMHNSGLASGWNQSGWKLCTTQLIIMQLQHSKQHSKDKTSGMDLLTEWNNGVALLYSNMTVWNWQHHHTDEISVWANHQHHNTIKIKGPSLRLFMWKQRWTVL